MKIGILTHFDSFQPSYALAVGWHERAQLLKHFNQDFDFLVNTRCPEGLYPNQKSILPVMKASMDYIEKVAYLTEWYKNNLQEYDVILTADIMYQRKGNFLAYNQAVKNASGHLKARWCHWIHSAWVQRPPENALMYPDRLRFEYHEGSTLVYLNSYELDGLAQMYGTDVKNTYCVYNPKDPRTFFDMSPLACEIVKELKFWEKDVIQIFPHCSTRMISKGIHPIASVFGALKRTGRKVGLVFANANSRSVQGEIDLFKEEIYQKYNLIEWEDYLFTSNMTENFRPLPRKDVADIFRLSNLFVFASWRETVGNCFQEAKAAGCFLVLSENLPCLKEMGGYGINNVMYFPATHCTIGVGDFMPGNLTQMNYPGGEERFMDAMAEGIAEALRRRGDLKERWKFSREWIWENQFRNLIYGTDTGNVHGGGE